MGKICSKEEQNRLCAGWRNSGLTQKVFCEQHDIKVKSLGRWLTEAKNREKLKFLPVAKANTTESIAITFPSGTSIKITASENFLINLIRGLL